MTVIARRHPTGIDLGDLMTRLLDDRLLPERFQLGTSLAGKEVMRIEEFAEEDTFVVRADMPGIDPDKDVEISIHDGLLHIRAERRDSSEHKDQTGFRSEFHYGMFERLLTLPAGTRDSDVTATYKDGVLEVRLPKALETQTSTVPVVRLP